MTLFLCRSIFQCPQSSVPKVLALLVVSFMIMTEGALSFLGLGVPAPTPSWVGMIAEGREVPAGLQKTHNISLGELCSGSRRRVVVEARGSISWIAVRELGYSGADVARYLGVTKSCVTRYVSSGEKPDFDDLIRKF